MWLGRGRLVLKFSCFVVGFGFGYMDLGYAVLVCLMGKFFGDEANKREIFMF